MLVAGPGSLLRALCGPGARDGDAVDAAVRGQAVLRRPALGGALARLGYRSAEVDWL